MHHIPYALNIVILLPVVWGMIRLPSGTPIAAFTGSHLSPEPPRPPFFGVQPKGDAAKNGLRDQAERVDGAADAPALRMMVASLWCGVLVLSAVALTAPLTFWPLLVFQVIYKALFLALYCLPIWLGRETGVIPTGPVAVFIFIIAIWPFFIVMALQSGQT